MTDQAAQTVLGQTLPQNSDQTENYLEALVGEGKKYKTVADLAKGYINADMHIKELKEAQETRTKDNGSLDEIVTLLRKQNGDDRAPPNGAAQQVPPALGPADVTKAVDQALRDREIVQKIKVNQDASLQLLDKHYGSREATLLAVQKVINGDKTIEEVVDRLGNNNPDALYKFVTTQLPTLVQGTNTPGATKTGSAALLAPGTAGLTWSDAQKVRKDNPKLYRSAEYRAQLEKAVAAAMAKGTDFYAT